MTVVVEGAEGMTWVGRYHERNDRGVQMHDVALYEPASATLPLSAWIERLMKFGIRVDAKHLVIPNESAIRIVRLTEYAQST